MIRPDGLYTTRPARRPLCGTVREGRPRATWVRVLAAWGILCGAVAAPAADDWYPSAYGIDDTIGAANHLSPSKVKSALGLVSRGEVHSLGVVVGPDTPKWGSRKWQVLISKAENGSNEPMAKNRITGHDDVLISHMGIGSQIDGLGHIGIDGLYYNGAKPGEFVRPDGLLKLGTEGIPPIVTRGVLLDMAAYLGVPFVPAGTAFNRVEIEGALKVQGIALVKGDVVIFHTGWPEMQARDPAAFMTQAPGLGMDGAAFLAAAGVVAVGADTVGVEVIPAEDPEMLFPVHQELLTRNGVYLLEFLDTRALAREHVHEFLFVLAHARIKGTVQMMINPLAIH